MPIGIRTKQDEEKLRRRQAKREQLMKKRKDMEERLEEEATKMAELTESAKKKGESKFMSEEAKRDAEERIRAEAEVVAQLERQAAEMVLQRENMQKQLAERENQKVAEIEANSSALKTKRAMVEARMRQEEEEIKSLSEAAKREVSGIFPARCWRRPATRHKVLCRVLIVLTLNVELRAISFGWVPCPIQAHVVKDSLSLSPLPNR